MKTKTHIIFIAILISFIIIGIISCGNNPNPVSGGEKNTTEAPIQPATLAPLRYIITDENYVQFIIDGYECEYRNDNQEDILSINTGNYKDKRIMINGKLKCGIDIVEFSKKKHLYIELQ